MLYRLSRLVPVPFVSRCEALITETECFEGGHGNHFVSGAHRDAERFSWWQWRGRVFRMQTVRVCLP